ncbi:MAG: flippase-like domain-containing protein [Anaerolineae bacterium]|nr:flippase-like domain-containing protein [Anaerolineae bacterium]
MNRRWQFWAGIAISVAALALALLGIDPQQAVTALEQARYVYLIPAAGLFLLYLLARSIRWRLLLGPATSLARCFWVTAIGYMVSNILPFRLGDPARAIVIGLGGEVAVSTALSTVVVERVLDMLVVVLVLAGIAPFVSEAANVAQAGWIAGGLAAIALLGLVVLAFHPHWGQRAVRRALEKISPANTERWEAAWEGFLAGLAPLRSGRRSLTLFGWSLVTWACATAFYWSILQAILPHPPVLAAPFLVCVLGLGMAIPSSPGAVGVFHAIARYGLAGPFGVPTDQAISAAFVLHTFQYLAIWVLGPIGLLREGISLAWLWRKASTLKEVQ